MSRAVAPIAGLGCAVCAAALGLWLSSPSGGSSSARPEPAISRDDGRSEARIMLTRAQSSEAIASGTIDRPVKSLLTVPKPLRFGDYLWDEKAVPPGPILIRVDLGSQLISVFRGGHEIGTAVIVYGGENKETPIGKLHVLAKDRDHRSSLYDAAMPYTLQLTTDGVSIHGSSVRWGAATHCCIGVPLEFAQKLFESTKVGDEVLIVGSPAPAAQEDESNRLVNRKS